ncbi:MAG: prepilin-type N-terminal cleavage/methylation domain-containing protein [Opitutales bacterium]|nr:prepilin-type N-terminal cleavage/methylation domain-containing protein [Opitutales bacterium]MCH8539721.1 GspH/FimT family protein [Opitutales bacterium]
MTLTSNKAFTLIEIIAVLLLLGVLGAVIGVHFTRSPSQLVTERDRLELHLRHAQIQALADTDPWEIEFLSGGTSWQLIPPPDSASIARLPGVFSPSRGESNDTRVFVSGITVSGASKIRFDALGRPVNNSDTPISSALTLTLSDGTNTRTLTILPETGLVQ